MAETITLDGKEYPLATMTRGDWDELLRYVRKWSVSEARSAVTELPKDLQLEALRAVACYVPTINLRSPEFATYRMTKEGAVMVLWLGIVRANPAVATDRERIMGLLADHPSTQ